MDNAMTNASAFPGSLQSMFAAYADTLSFGLSNYAVSGQHRCTMPELEGSSTSGVMTPAGVLFKFEEVDSLIYPDDPGEVATIFIVHRIWFAAKYGWKISAFFSPGFAYDDLDKLQLHTCLFRVRATTGVVEVALLRACAQSLVSCPGHGD